MAIKDPKAKLQLTVLPTLLILWLLSLFSIYNPIYGAPTFTLEDPSVKLAVFAALTIITSTAYFVTGFYNLIKDKIK